MFNFNYFKMKKNYFLKAFLALSFLLPMWLHAQVSTFDDNTLEPDSYWNGSDLSGGFLSGDAWFFNSYDTTYGNWDGFSYSNETDTTTAGWSNQYSAFPGSGANSSSNFAIAHVPADWMSGTYNPVPVGVKLQLPLAGAMVKGVYVTNATYAALSMRDGDAYAKKFGGETGNDPDWFMLIIRGYNQGVFTDSVSFYLADYRSSDNSQDYIVNYWAYVDLIKLGIVDSLTFSLQSSDVGDYGMNTPAYFCIDNLNDIFNGFHEISAPVVSVYPNPVSNILNIYGVNNATVTLSDVTGRILWSVKSRTNSLQTDITSYPKGLYFVTVTRKDNSLTKKIVKR